MNIPIAYMNIGATTQRVSKHIYLRILKLIFVLNLGTGHYL